MNAIKATIREIIIIGVICLCLAAAANVVSPARIPWIGEWVVAQNGIPPNPGGRCKPTDVIPEFETILQSFKAKTAMFVDARSADSYQEGHVPGAVSLPVGSSDEKLIEFMALYGLSTNLIVYCTGEGCDDSHELAEVLKNRGYANITVFRGGITEWRQRQQEVKSGAEP